MPEVNVVGLQELRETLLKTLPENLQGRALQGALTIAARPIITAAKRLAPKDTGRLQRAIYAFRDRASTKFREGRLISVRSGKKFKSSDRDAFYWKWVEFGRAIVNASPGKKTLGTPKTGFFGKQVSAVPARPFMRPAFESQKFIALEKFRETLADQIKKVADRAYKRSVARLRAKLLRGF